MRSRPNRRLSTTRSIISITSDFAATHETLDRIVAAHPQDPLPYAFRAAGYLFSELDRMGTLAGEFLSADDWAYDKKKKAPDPAVRAQMQKALSRRRKAAARPRSRSTRTIKNALFALTIAQGVTADYMALVDKRQFGSLSPSKLSNNYAQRLLKLDPKFYDAYLTAGFSEYVLGSLPFFVRWFVHWDNVNGNKEAGKQHLELGRARGPLLQGIRPYSAGDRGSPREASARSAKTAGRTDARVPGKPAFPPGARETEHEARRRGQLAAESPPPRVPATPSGCSGSGLADKYPDPSRIAPPDRAPWATQPGRNAPYSTEFRPA